MNARVRVPITNVWRDPEAAEVGEADEGRTPAPGREGWTWVKAQTTAIRHTLEERLDTQALLGEPVIVLTSSGEWSEVRLPWQPSNGALDGYPGWVRTAHLVADDSPAIATPSAGAVVTALGTLATTVAADTVRLSFGTVLTAVDDGFDDHVLVKSPDDTVLSVSRADLALPAERAQLDLIQLARRFQGLPYLWGGLAGAGTDCSGLVHLCARAIGTVVPRDAHDQALALPSVEPGDVRPGDAVYFENDHGVHHTGLALTRSRLLHSPRTGKSVTEGSIVDDYPSERVGFRRINPPTKPDRAGGLLE